MIDAGLPVSLHSDDPAMHGADPGEVYIGAVTALGLDVDGAIDLCLAAVDAASLDGTDRRDLRRSFQQQIADLHAQL